MANKFNVFVYEVGELWAYLEYNREGEYSLFADFEDVDGNITSCRIVNLNDKKGREDELYIYDDKMKRWSAFAERLLEADEFYIEVRCKAPHFGDVLALEHFTQILSRMVRVHYLVSGASIKCNLRDTPRNVERREAPQEYWEELEMRKLLGNLCEVSSEIETLCVKSNVQQINLEGGQVDVSEVLTYLETMRANIFDKLNSPKKQQAVA